MPAPDGRPMLWPTTRTSGPRANPTILHGFVDANGKVVLPARFESYLYCPDATGRAAFVILSRAGQPDEIRGLDGGLLRRTPTSLTACVGTDHVIVTDVIDGELDKVDSAIMTIATGAFVVPFAKNRRIVAIDDHTVNVSDPSGEYFLDLATKRRTPHPGWLAQESFGAEPALLPAAGGATRPGAQDSPRIGLLDRQGRWALKPSYSSVSGFLAGHAVVSWESGTGFLDEALHRVGVIWDEAWPITRPVNGADSVLAYRVRQGEGNGLLGPDLKPLVEPTAQEIYCGTDLHLAWCAVRDAQGRTTAVSLPDGATHALPEGFSQVLSSYFYADTVAKDEEGHSRRILATGTGVVIDLPDLSSCQGVGTWALCRTTTGLVQTLIFDAAGNRADFASIEPIADPSGSGEPAYYWVTAGPFQGFVDAQGTWRYRESRYTQLED